ncbi:ssDNA binding protein [Penicillium sp. IBT 35674x]|nr:ssDNA binding protein [Penicillium sp. IBT 35674x]
MSAFTSLRPTLRLANTATRTFSSSAAHSVARMTITGRLAADPEIQATSTGQDVIKYAVGTSYGPRDNRQTSWFKIASFAEGGQRDYLMSLQKGTLVYVEGDARMKTYEDAEGRKQSSLSIVQRSIEVLSRPQGNESQ